MAYSETLRPNGDSTPLEWTSTEATHYEAINQDVGTLGFIPSVDTTRIAGLNGRIYTGGIGDIDTHTWTNWTGSAAARIKKLTLRYAAYVVPLETPSVHTIEAYIEDVLVGSITITIERQPDNDDGTTPFIIIGEEAINLAAYITPTQLNTMKTKIVYASGTSNSFLALECVATTTEKTIVEPDPIECKTIGNSYPLEKKI